MNGGELIFFSGRLVVDVQLQLNVETSSLTQIYPSKGYEGLHDVWHPPEVMCLIFIKLPPSAHIVADLLFSETSK